MVGERGELGRGAERQARLHHRAQHHLHPERAGRLDGAPHLAQPAGLHELEVHAVHPSRQVREVRGAVHALVREHRDAAALAHPAQAVQVLARHRLLDQLEVERLDLAQDAHRLGGVPGRIGVHPDAAAVAGPDASQVVHVALATQLDLEHREIHHRVELALHLLGRGHAEGHARERGAGRIEPEPLPDRQLEPLADPVVQRHLDGGARRAVAVQDGAHAPLDGVEGEGILAQARRPGGERPLDQRPALAVVVRRRGLPQPLDAVVLDLDQRVRVPAAGPDRDAELERGRERQRLMAQSHGVSSRPAPAQAPPRSARRRSAPDRWRAARSRAPRRPPPAAPPPRPGRAC